ncbi:37S ribosomal protein S10, mitochondrial [Ceratocystis fimbriata CBS 114723]|uniref:Small ribosomal subunit protein uS10m n=1 Tax=Ceratocystis fimbriata CBS 114723 TaxID=1035309 RepID=A0A2C5WV63_9PEZI|nr:37S ribosomal protein S10, mitochondrial [Ceratocystis fimbriata CBS 114723]
MKGSTLMPRAIGPLRLSQMPTINGHRFLSRSAICSAEPVAPKPSFPTPGKLDAASETFDLSSIKKSIEYSKVNSPASKNPENTASINEAEEKLRRLPMSVQAIYMKPLKRAAKYGIPSCDLQLRSYSLRPLEFFADFALRAAYYLNLPAYGPVPLPQITERWTVPRSHFIFKKSQENFERVTKRRLIQIRDGDPQAVQVWLAFLRKHAFYGVGTKANVWEFSELGVGKTMDVEVPESQEMNTAWGHFAQDRPYKFKDLEQLEKLVEQPKFRRPYRDAVTEVPAHSELMWILSCTSSVGYLSRMTQWKSKLSMSSTTNIQDEKARASLKLGLFSYPVLQAADILVYRATHVPVGDDQRQHLEFTRECVTNFNSAYKKKILVAPQTIIPLERRIMSLQSPSQKMSKSHADPKSRILITDAPEVIHKKIMSSLTDSQAGITYDPQGRPGVSNLIDILCAFDPSERSPVEIVKDLSRGTLKDLKMQVSEAVISALSGIGPQYTRILSEDNGKYIDFVEQQSAKKAKQRAAETMELVRNAVGF